tara:strand:+ start:637 stop:1047 length:411 start_codon:yes stop_codon:yes gene_type:complete
MKLPRSNAVSKYFFWELKDFQNHYNNEEKFKVKENGVERLMYPPEVLKKDPHFYKILHEKRFLQKVITNRKNILTKGWDEDDFREYIEENFEGLTNKEMKEKNWNFVQTIYRKKLGHLLPKKGEVVTKSKSLEERF